MRLDERLQQQIRGRRVNAQHGKLARIGSVRQYDESSRSYNHSLTPGEAPEGECNPISNFHRAYFISDLQDSPHASISDDGGQFRMQRQQSARDQNVAEINGHELNADQYLRDAGLFGLRQVSIHEDGGRAAIGSENDCFHVSAVCSTIGSGWSVEEL